MLEKIEYIRKNQRIVIYRCYGEGSVLEVPGQIDGLPVTELADHCFAGEPSLRYKAPEIETAYYFQGAGVWKAPVDEKAEDGKAGDGQAGGGKAGEERASNGKAGDEKAGECRQTGNSSLCTKLEEIWLPPQLQVIGDYAFYGCLRLKRLHVPYSLTRLGGGAFVACNHIEQVFFGRGDKTTPYCMKDILAELTYEVEVILEESQGQPPIHLIFPEYYEEGKENTPARIIELVYHGTGYKYRQCFQNRQIDIRQYDLLFPQAVAQEFLPTVLRLAVNRLRTPVNLSEEARERYIEWLRKEYRMAADWFISKDQMDLLYLCGTYEYYTEEILEYFLDRASKEGRAEAVSYLMDYRRNHFAPKRKKKYEL